MELLEGGLSVPFLFYILTSSLVSCYLLVIGVLGDFVQCQDGQRPKADSYKSLERAFMVPQCPYV